MGNLTNHLLPQSSNHDSIMQQEQWADRVGKVWEAEYLPDILDAWLYEGEVTATNPNGLACHVFYAKKQADFDARFGVGAHDKLMEVLSDKIQKEYDKELKNGSR